MAVDLGVVGGLVAGEITPQKKPTIARTTTPGISNARKRGSLRRDGLCRSFSDAGTAVGGAMVLESFSGMVSVVSFLWLLAFQVLLHALLGISERARQFHLGKVVGVQTGDVVLVGARQRTSCACTTSRLSLTPAVKRSCACVKVCSARSTELLATSTAPRRRSGPAGRCARRYRSGRADLPAGPGPAVGKPLPATRRHAPSHPERSAH